jgi:hypothetical protein
MSKNTAPASTNTTRGDPTACRVQLRQRRPAADSGGPRVRVRRHLAPARDREALVHGGVASLAGADRILGLVSLGT